MIKTNTGCRISNFNNVTKEIAGRLAKTEFKGENGAAWAT